MSKKARKERGEPANVFSLTAQAVEAGWSTTARLIVLGLIAGVIMIAALAIIPHAGFISGVLIALATLRKAC